MGLPAQDPGQVAGVYRQAFGYVGVGQARQLHAQAYGVEAMATALKQFYGYKLWLPCFAGEGHLSLHFFASPCEQLAALERR
jgi:hypothetical protein